jgi:hypothetical protein
MNNEFQWRSGMRKLDERVEPASDLWPAIAARIEREARVVPLRPRAAWRQRITAVAATLVIASGAGLIAYRQHGNGDVAQTAPATPVPASTGAHMKMPRTALDWAVPADPKLAAAAQDLDQASADLQAALEARPDAVFLVSMINRTNAQRMRLLRQSAISG